MQEEQQSQQPNHDENSTEPLAMPERPQVDWYLQQLVNMANDRGVQMGITLVVGGAVITGTLISGATYFEAFAEQFASGWTDEESKETMRNALAEPARLYTSGVTDPRGPSFIHLKDAHFASPSGSMPGQDVLWRGRLTEVSGFSLGVWSR